MSDGAKSWRRFNFFDKEVLKTQDNEVFNQLKDIDISVCTSGHGQIVLGDYDGCIHFISRRLDIKVLPAYDLTVSHLYQLKQHHILVSIGQDEKGINPLIKVWNLEKVDRSGGPLCVRILRAIPGNTPTPVTALTVHENLNYMAVGFENGSIVLYRGDVTRDSNDGFEIMVVNIHNIRHSKKPSVIYEGPHPITSLSFKTQNHEIVLFISTDHHVMVVNVSSKMKEQRVSPTVLDQHGCKRHCSVLTDATQDYQFVIGRQDALYFYQPDGRGPCLASEGEKLCLQWYRGYLVIISRETKGLPGSGTNRSMNVLTIYDIQNKFIAYTSPMSEVLDVVWEWGSLYVITEDRLLYHLQEKDTQTKLELLFKKNLYELAISLAKSQHYDADGIMDIFRQYGDHLYAKGDLDGAIIQYIKTIGKLEASYVIRQFLDAQHIHNLTAYLQALHKAQLATEDHTTLLLNCYTKLKDVDKLDEFIMTDDRDIDFEVETAIRVCRSAGYHKHALSLSERHERHDWYLKVQLEDNLDYQAALKYIGKLPFEEANCNMKKYGKMLMSKAPEETTELLKGLCTDYRPIGTPLVDEQSLQGLPPEVSKANPEEFIHIFVSKSKELTEFLETMIKVQPKCASVIYNTLLELYLHDVDHQKDITKKNDQQRKILDLLQHGESGYDLDQALVLCQMHNFKAAVLYLYEKARLYQQILHFHMEQNDYVHIVDTCKNFGTLDSNLWIQALSYFASKEENCKTQLTEVLSHINKYNLLSPLLVITTLAHNSNSTLAIVKEYITNRLQKESDQVTEDARLIKQYKDETEKMKQQIEQLKTSPKIFQSTVCSVCSRALELPSVHFLCQHSFHYHCFEGYAELDSECPVCKHENRKVLDIIRAQDQSRDLHDHFHNQLERAPDGFAVIADYFGRGVFNKVTLITDSPTEHSKSPFSTSSRH